MKHVRCQIDTIDGSAHHFPPGNLIHSGLRDISSFGGQTWTTMIIPQILDIWLLRRPVLVMEIDEGDLPDTIPFYRMKQILITIGMILSTGVKAIFYVKQK